MKTYRTLENELIDLTALSPEQKKIYERVKRFYDKRPHWDKFEAFWLRQVDTLQPALTRKEIVNTPIWKICEDMDSRLAIEQGYARRGDYLDELLGLIETKLLRFGKNAPYEGETFPFLQCLNSLKRAGIAPGAAL